MPAKTVEIDKKLLTVPTRDKAIKVIAAKLAERRTVLSKALAGDLESLGEQSTNKGEPVDRALNVAQMSITTSLAENESLELQSIEEAMIELSEGSYGLCSDCGKNIMLARLQALNCAKRCISCQGRAEESGEV